MKISIIMPIYNAQDRLEKSIRSVLGQTYKKIELILINDGSVDDSLSICRAYEKNDPRIILIDSENSGPGAARNKGLARASGDYLCFVDADDWLKKNALKNLIFIALKEECDIVSSNHFRVDHKIRVSKNNYKTGIIEKKKGGNYDKFKTSSSFGYVWGKLYRTEFIKRNKIRFSEERKVFLEDTLFNLKAISYKPRYFVLNKPLYYYNVYEDSVSNRKEDITHRAIKLLESYEKFLDDHNIYDENLDLFIPLGGRVIAWSLMKSMDEQLSAKILYKRVVEFSKNKTVKRLFSHKNSFKQLRKTGSLAQTLLYSVILIGIRFSLERLLAGVFYLNIPLFKLYIKNALKN